MRHNSFDLTPQATNLRGSENPINYTAPYPFTVGPKSVVTTARVPFRKQFASFDQDMLRLRCTERCTSELCRGENADSNPCNRDLIFYSGDNRRLGQGYVSNYACGLDRTFGENNPKLSFDFNTFEGLSMYGLTLYFDEFSNTYPTKLKITTSLNGREQGYIDIKDHGGFELEIIPDANDLGESEIFKDFDQLTIEFMEMNRANIRVRMSKLLFGVMTKFDNEILKDTFSCEFDVDSRGCRLPIQKVNFTIHDPEHEFDVENPRGRHAYLTAMQPITATMYAHDQAGQPLTERGRGIPVCDMVLSGNVESGRGTVRFSGTSYLQSANGIVDLTENKVEPNMCLNALSKEGMSLHKALDCTFLQMGLPTIDAGQNRWYLHRSLHNINIKIDTEELEGKSLNECARMMAQAGKCVMFEDAYGTIHVRPRIHSHLQEATALVCLKSDYDNDPDNWDGEESGRDLSTLSTQEMSIIEALTRVFRQMELPLLNGDVRWRFPESPKELEKLMGPVPRDIDLSGLSLRNAATRLASIAGHTVSEDASGIIRIMPTPENGKELDDGIPRYSFDLMFDVPKLNKFPPLEKVVVEWNDDKQSSTIHGRRGGEVETIKSEIINGMNREDIPALANNIARELSLRNEYSTSVRGGIELEPFDFITVETKFLRDKTIEQFEEEMKDISLGDLERNRIKEEIDRIKNSQRAYVSKRTLRFNGAVNSDIKFFMHPINTTEGGDE